MKKLLFILIATTNSVYTSNEVPFTEYHEIKKILEENSDRMSIHYTCDVYTQIKSEILSELPENLRKKKTVAAIIADLTIGGNKVPVPAKPKSTALKTNLSTATTSSSKKPRSKQDSKFPVHNKNSHPETDETSRIDTANNASSSSSSDFKNLNFLGTTVILGPNDSMAAELKKLNIAEQNWIEREEAEEEEKILQEKAEWSEKMVAIRYPWEDIDFGNNLDDETKI